MSDTPRLDSIDWPADLRTRSVSDLERIASELRRFLIDTVARTGGHLAANLGTVELAIALHYVFDTPRDRIVWDVGHQAYAHKILTGRRDAMATLRQYGGLAGFPKRDESEYDAFGTGHSSTSISAAAGMALAAARTGARHRHVAVIGDGAMTAGMAYEALNHVGELDCDLLVILNDNEMSISPNVGAMSQYLARLLSGRLYCSVREGSKKVLEYMPPVRALAQRAEEHVKGMIMPGTLFEELGFRYFGPVDGHDVDGLVAMLSNLRDLRGPRLLHIVTRKGHGYAPAEDDPCRYHGVGQFSPDAGLAAAAQAKAPTYTEVFGNWLCDQARIDARLVGITPAMREGSGLVRFSEEFPDRYFDVGIAEQHAVTLAAGMACEGLHPVVAIYSTFLQRALDQVIHDVALQNLPVLFAIDRAGIVGPDGPTHAGVFDISLLRTVPNLVLMAPADEAECRRMLSTGFACTGPAAVRYPRGRGPGTAPGTDLDPIPVGKAAIVRNGHRIALLSFGPLLEAALEAAEAIDATVVNMRFIKPLDTDLLERLARDHERFVTLEDHALAGGAGSAVLEALTALDLATPCLTLGLPDHFTAHGPRERLLSDYGLDAPGILRAIHGDGRGEPPPPRKAAGRQPPQSERDA
ncbi:1-deoxy-D-xylulose-5-phosphate synthase [Thioalkalivibrio paradoxus]|uniref:1-deoxy-D-xylulose-5-phosphate synthase n=1 Tax=Thioalkalivibrio paradoxus ARh 1 TaxID=713585 RepID=W0DFE3_9GAMM|nr:1-deoxy-D-xylulose-5-phosphate synthase [Thioalkalivibrio paradoxus]AHE97349.1 1-deoxy-D-xylulose-5-phosphate synthase [Thioalkalivibrio paradoxus ARh 1]